MTEKSVSSERGKTVYWVLKNEAPEAKTLVFLPGLSADHRLFDTQFGEFSKDNTVIVWDAPGHGKSRPYKDFSYTNFAKELKAILDAEGVSRAVLIGQSGGGFTAQSFVALYPDMVAGIAVIGSCPYARRYYSRSDIFWLRQTKWLFSLYPDKMLRREIAKMCCVTERGRQNMLNMLSHYGNRELCTLLYLGFAGFISDMCDLTIKCPVCLILGEHDRTGKVRQYMTRWHEETGYPLHIIKNAAHNTNDDNPEKVNAVLRDFLSII